MIGEYVTERDAEVGADFSALALRRTISVEGAH
jgi:hypothetical protein